MKYTICKKKKKKEKYIMDYEYALLEKQRNRPTNCSWGREHNRDYRWAHGTESTIDDPAALLPTTWCQLQAASLFSVSCWLRREIKEDVIRHHGRREDNGRGWILFLGPDVILCCYYHLGGHLCSHGGHGGPGGHFFWLSGGGHG